MCSVDVLSSELCSVQKFFTHTTAATFLWNETHGKPRSSARGANCHELDLNKLKPNGIGGSLLGHCALILAWSPCQPWRAGFSGLSCASCERCYLLIMIMWVGLVVLPSVKWTELCYVSRTKYMWGNMLEATQKWQWSKAWHEKL